MRPAITWAALLPAVLLLTGCDPDNPEVMVGTLERDRIELRVESTEPISAIEIVDGTRVKAGDVVLRQDSSRNRARLAQAEAERDRAAARLAELRRGPREEAIREAQARLQASTVVTRNARADYERALEIFDRDLSNQATLDSARTLWEAAQARELADREALSALLNGTTVEELQQAQAALAAMEAGVVQARLDLERLTVIAPVDGVVDDVLYQLGERPGAGATVAILLDSRRSYARLYVPQPLRARVVPGARFKVRVDGVEKALDGTVRWVSSDASFTPYFALTEHDRSRLSYLAEVDLDGAADLPVGLPLEAELAP